MLRTSKMAGVRNQWPGHYDQNKLGTRRLPLLLTDRGLMSKSRRQKYTYDYPRPSVTVDLVLVTRDARPKVLLIRRKHDPFAGLWALPGGFVDPEEPLEMAARRELREETGVDAETVEQLHTFGDPGRDPRGWTISVAYLARIDAANVRPRAEDDAAEVGWHSLHRPPALAFDHAQILAWTRRRLKNIEPLG
jgi:8-oxo-dGTP diphosphatase